LRFQFFYGIIRRFIILLRAFPEDALGDADRDRPQSPGFRNPARGSIHIEFKAPDRGSANILKANAMVERVTRKRLHTSSDFVKEVRPSPGCRSSYQIAAAAASSSATRSFLTTKLIQTLTSAFHRAIPGLQQVGMSQCQVAAPQNFSLLIVGEFVLRTFLSNDMIAVFFKPHNQLVALLWGEREDGRFQLFQAHAENVHRSKPFGEPIFATHCPMELRDAVPDS